MVVVASLSPKKAKDNRFLFLKWCLSRLLSRYWTYVLIQGFTTVAYHMLHCALSELIGGGELNFPVFIEFA